VKSPVDLIIQHGYVVTMDPTHRLIADGAVAVQGNTIVAVDTTAAIREQYSAAETLDASDMVVMPGLVDTYGHAGHGMLKGIYHPNVPWPTRMYFHATTEGWWYAEGLLSALERLRAGVTCGFTVIGATPARVDSPVFAARQAQAVAEVGVRGVLGVGPPDPHVSHVPEPWSGTIWEGDTPVERQFSFEDAVANSVAFIEQWHGAANGRVQAAIHYPYLFGRQAAHPRIPFVYRDEHVPLMIQRAEEMRALADRYGLLLHSHAFVGSVQFGLDHYGAPRVHDLLRAPVTLAHCNGLTETEVKTLGEAGTGVAVVPYTHENLLYGPCPVIELLQAGANPTVSTDGTYPYVSYDLWKEIARVVWTQWTRFNNQRLFPPGKALRMVTIDAARALGLDHLIGSLEVGKRADIILLNLRQPHLTPRAHIPRLLAFYATGADVDTVLVDGRVLMRGRQVRSVNPEQIIDLARDEARLAFERYPIDDFLQMDDQFWTGWTF
jgi:5-methylthioadenosine/S-adenosylhomocysteine deaminase